MIVNYPAGSGVAPLPVAIQAPPKEKKPRRVTVPGGNSQYAVSKPDKTSPLRTFSALCEAHGWHTEYIKFPCWCEDWTDRQDNSVVIWRGTVHHSWCVCQVRKMSEEQMLEVIA